MGEVSLLYAGPGESPNATISRSPESADPPPSTIAPDVRFNVLGPLSIIHGEQEHAPSAPKVLQVLAMLVFRANQIVPTETLIQQLWGETPPRSSLTTIQTYIYQLRRFMESRELAPRGDNVLVTQPRGYVLRVRPEQVDLQMFRSLSELGRTSFRQGHYKEAAAHLNAALSVSRGRPLANIPLDWHLAAYVAMVEEQQRAALELRIQAEMELGLHRDLIGELRSLVALHPVDEGLHSQLIRVLNRSGRRGDALRVYHDIRLTLREELGLDPSPDLQALYQELLQSA